MRYHTVTVFLPKKEKAIVSYVVQRLLKEGVQPSVEELDDYLIDRVHYPASCRPKDVVLVSIHTTTPAVEVDRLTRLVKEVKRRLKSQTFLTINNELMAV